MSGKDLITIVQTVGFPIFVCLWFMWREKKYMERHSQQMEKVITVMTVMAKTLDVEIPETSPPTTIVRTRKP